MENEKITMALWLMRNKSSSRGMKQCPLRPSQMYITYIPHAVVQLLWVVLDISRNNCCFGWIGLYFLSFFSQRFVKRAHLPSTWALKRARGRDRAERAPVQPLWGAAGKSAAGSGMALSFIKFIEFFTNGWTQFPSNFLIMQICKISNLDQFKTATAPNLPV